MLPSVSTRVQRPAAYHEAGHAIAFVVLGYSFRYVTIRSSSGGLAGAVVRDGGATPIDARDYFVIAAAGPASEARWTLNELGRSLPESLQRQITRATNSDLTGLQDIEGSGEAPVRQHLREAHVLIRDNWDAVTRVAETLVSSPRALTARQVRNFVYPGGK